MAKVRISPEEKGIRLAAKNFLNKKGPDIALDLKDSLQGNMREIIGTLTLEKINTDRDSFSDQVMQKASRDMEKLGIEILSCNIQNVQDENGLIQDLGAENTSLIKRTPAIAKAQADRDVAIAPGRRRQGRQRRQSGVGDPDRPETKPAGDSEGGAENHRRHQAGRGGGRLRDSEPGPSRKSSVRRTVDAEIAKTAREAELKKQEVEVAKQGLGRGDPGQGGRRPGTGRSRRPRPPCSSGKRDAEAKRYEQEQKRRP